MASVKAEISYPNRSITVDCPRGGRATLIAGEDNSKDYVLSTFQLMPLVRTDALAELYVVQLNAKPEGDAEGELAGGSETKALLGAIVAEYAEVWTEPPPGVSEGLGIEHSIPMKEGHVPPWRPAYRLSAEEQAELECTD
jgi:hypothetical protein